MSFNINQFRSQFLTTGLSTTNFFEVRFTRVPTKIGLAEGVGFTGGRGIEQRAISALEGAVALFGTDITKEKLRFLCQSASIPGRNVFSTQYKDYGNSYTIAQSEWSDTPLTLQIICPIGLKVNKFFHDWQGLAVNRSTFDVGYYEEYVGEVQVVKFDPEGNKEAIYTFEQVWPINIGQMDLNWADQNNVCRLPVTFVYRKWHAEYRDQPASVLRTISNASGAVIGGIGGII